MEENILFESLVCQLTFELFLSLQSKRFYMVYRFSPHLCVLLPRWCCSHSAAVALRLLMCCSSHPPSTPLGQVSAPAPATHFDELSPWLSWLRLRYPTSVKPLNAQRNTTGVQFKRRLTYARQDNCSLLPHLISLNSKCRKEAGRNSKPKFKIHPAAPRKSHLLTRHI